MAMLFWLLVLLAMAWGLADWQLSRRDDLSAPIIIKPAKRKPTPAPVAASAEGKPQADAGSAADQSGAEKPATDQAFNPVEENGQAGTEHPAPKDLNSFQE